MASVVVASWDVDGQASASMLIRSGYADTVFFPDVGVYWLEEEWIERLSHYDYIYVVDMHLRRRDISRLTSHSYVYIIDDSKLHPSYRGLKATCVCQEGVSTTYILMEYFGVEPDIDAILGMYHDMGDRVLNNEYWDIFAKYLENMDMGLDDLKRLVRLLNVPMYTGDLMGLYRNVETLMRRLRGFDEESASEMLRRVDRYIEGLATYAKPDGIVELGYEGEMYVVVDLVKSLVRRFGGRDVLVHDHGFIGGYVSIGAYSGRRDLRPLIRRLLREDLPTGGDRRFLGLVVEEGVAGRYIDMVRKYIMDGDG